MKTTSFAAVGLALVAATPATATFGIISCILGELPIIGSLFPCIDVLNNPQHCGSLSYSCPLDPWGSALCNQGSCSINCDQGYGWCNENKCTNLATDVNNCGWVGNVCASTSNGSPTCSNGACGIVCSSGYGLVNGQCISLSSSPTNCGRVGNVCPSPANGNAICQSGSCSTQCNPGYGLLNGACKSTTGDTSNCGSIGHSCPTTANGAAICANSQCSLSCNQGYGLKGSSCIGILTDTSNCGAVGVICPTIGNATASCTGGSCGLACNSGFTLGSGVCVDTADDINNCGSIGNVCASVIGGNVKCYSGQCTLTCAPNYELSGSTCIPIPVTTITVTSTVLTGSPTSVPTTAPTTAPTTTKTKTTKTKTTKTKTTVTSTAGPTTTSSSSFPNPTSCPGGTAREQWGLYPGYQTTANGLAATYAATVEDCAAQCYALPGCVSFDFWDTSCGIQVGGSGFDGFVQQDNVIHGVPGPCSSQLSLCPASAMSDCEDLAECIAVSVATDPYALYDGYQSTAAGLDAVAASSVDDCAALCGANSECKSFDYWVDGSQGQCGIQIVGSGFQGFQPDDGVIHGVPGTCSQEANKCPVDGASCTDISVAPATSNSRSRFVRRHRKMH